MRSGRTSTSANPARGRHRRPRRPGAVRSRSTSTPPGSSQSGASATMRSRSSSPDSPLTSASTGSCASTSGASVGVLRGRHVRRVAHHEAELAPQLDRQRVEPVAVRRDAPASQPSRCSRRWPARPRGRLRWRRWPTPRRRGARPRARARARRSRCRDRRPRTGVACRPRVGATSPRAPPRTASSIATWPTTSVSGRGIRTRGSTMRSRPRNDHLPEDVLQRLPAQPALDHRVDPVPGQRRRDLVVLDEAARRRCTRRLAARSSALRPPPRRRRRRRAAPRPRRGPPARCARRRSRTRGHRSPSCSARRPRRARRRSRRAGSPPASTCSSACNVTPDAMVGDAVLLEVVGADLLGPTAALHLAAARRRQLGFLALPLDLEQP